MNGQIDILTLALFAIAAISGIFVLALIFVTPGLPDEVIPAIIALVAGVIANNRRLGK